jgi:exonuclease III
LRCSVHNQKPSVLILTETRIPDRQYTGTGVFKGYRMTQHSSSGNRAGGVTIFTRKDLEVIPDSVYGSPSGHFAIGCYDFHGSRVVIGGIYGVSAGSDAASMEVFEEFHNKITETATLHRTRTVIIGGDFNVKLDVPNNGKPRTTNRWNDIVMEFDLIEVLS